MYGEFSNALTFENFYLQVEIVQEGVGYISHGSARRRKRKRERACAGVGVGLLKGERSIKHTHMTKGLTLENSRGNSCKSALLSVCTLNLEAN